MKNFGYASCAILFFLILCICDAYENSKTPHTRKILQRKTENVVRVKEYDGIVAVVNGDVITKTDLDARMSLALFSIGGNVNQEQKFKLLKEVLREMIHEALKKQCAQKFSPKKGWVTPKDVKKAFSNIAHRNQTDYDGLVKLLKSNHIEKEVLLDQIAVELSWGEYIRAKFDKNINIAESEVNRTFIDVNDKLTKESFYVCRMFFPINNPSEEKFVLSHVNNLSQMLLRGADFSNIARQFSKSADANNGGDIGWVYDGQLSAAEMNALRQMPVGSHRIVRNDRGYVILLLRDKKDTGLRTFTSIKYVQIGVGFDGEKQSGEDLRQLVDYISNMRKTSKNCQEFIKKAGESGFMSISDPASGVVESMQLKFRAMVDKIPEGGMSDPIVVEGGVVVICVLEKKVNTIQAPTRDEIKAQKIQERLSVLAARELQDLIRKSYVKINKKYDIEL